MIINYLQRYLLLFIFLSSSIVSCDENTTTSCDFDKSALIEETIKGQGQLIYQQLADDCANLHQAAMDFVAAPTLVNLDTLRFFYTTAYLQFQSTGSYQFEGFVETHNGSQVRFNTFPTNTENIETNIDNAALDIAANFKSTVGFPAIEYIIFGAIGTTKQAIIDQFINSEKRGQYLTALTENLQTTANLLNNNWSTYLQSIQNDISASEGSPIALLVNQLNFHYETLKNFKFKVPLGQFNGGVVQPQQLEGYYSDLSIPLAQQHFQGIRQVYNLIQLTPASENTIYQYLVCLQAGEDNEELLADAIINQLVIIENLLNNLQSPLRETLVNDKASVDAVHLEMQKLVPLLKRELPSALGVKISYTDNDGD